MVLRASAILTMLALTGCEEPLTLAQVCKETPGFCSDLNKDSHCKNERSEVILKRYVEYKKPTDENKSKADDDRFVWSRLSHRRSPSSLL